MSPHTNILITGNPGVGKTTLMVRLEKALEDYRPAGLSPGRSVWEEPGKGFCSSVVRMPDGNIRSGYPLPYYCKDDRGIEIPARRFRAMTDLATTRITALHKTGDGTIFRAVAGGLARNVPIISGDGLFCGVNGIWAERLDEWGRKRIVRYFNLVL
jgi:hypothetical protein